METIQEFQIRYEIERLTREVSRLQMIHDMYERLSDTWPECSKYSEECLNSSIGIANCKRKIAQIKLDNAVTV